MKILLKNGSVRTDNLYSSKSQSNAPPNRKAQQMFMLPQIERMRYLPTDHNPAVLAQPRLRYVRVQNTGIVMHGFWGTSVCYDDSACRHLDGTISDLVRS